MRVRKQTMKRTFKVFFPLQLSVHKKHTLLLRSAFPRGTEIESLALERESERERLVFLCLIVVVIERENRTENESVKGKGPSVTR